jgi:hypothetical protein
MLKVKLLILVFIEVTLFVCVLWLFLILVLKEAEERLVAILFKFIVVNMRVSTDVVRVSSVLKL